MSLYNYTSMSSTLKAVQAQNFKEIQAEEQAKKLLEKHGLPEALFDSVKQQCLANPKLKLDEKKLAALQLQMPKDNPVLKVATVVDVERLSAALASLGSGSGLVVPKCWSSIAMERLMNWRNPDAAAKPTVLRSFVNLTKRAVTELALPLLTVTAAVETVATKALVFGASLLKRPTENLTALNKSAGFTTLWTVSTIWHNIVNTALPADELDARRDLFKGYFKI